MDRRDKPETAGRPSEAGLHKAFRVIIQSYKGISPEKLYGEATHCFDALIDISHNTNDIRDFASKNEIDLKYLVDGANFVISKMHFNPENNYYITLGLPQEASPDEIKARWKRLMLLYHPDRQDGQEEWVSARAKKVNEAYTTLKDDSKRMAYTKKLMDQVIHQKPVQQPRARRRSVSRSADSSLTMDPTWNRIRKSLPRTLVVLYLLAALIAIGFIYLKNRSSDIETEFLAKQEQPSVPSSPLPSSSSPASKPSSSTFSSSSDDPSTSSAPTPLPVPSSKSSSSTFTSSSDAPSSSSSSDLFSSKVFTDKKSDAKVKKAKPAYVANRKPPVVNADSSKVAKKEINKVVSTSFSASNLKPRTSNSVVPSSTSTLSSSSPSQKPKRITKAKMLEQVKPPELIQPSIAPGKKTAKKVEPAVQEDNQAISPELLPPPVISSKKTAKKDEQTVQKKEPVKIDTPRKTEIEENVQKTVEDTKADAKTASEKVTTQEAKTMPAAPVEKQAIRHELTEDTKTDAKLVSKGTISPKAKAVPVAPVAIVKRDLITHEEVEDFIKRYIETYEKKDLDALMSLFSRSAIENDRMNYAEIRSAYQETFRENIDYYRLNNMNISIDGPSAMVSGRYDIKRYYTKQERWVNYTGKISWKLLKKDSMLRIVSVYYDN